MTIGGIDLLPCPTCGSTSTQQSIRLSDLFEESELRNQSDMEAKYYLHLIICSATEGGCGTSGPFGEDTRDAIYGWNTRRGSVAIPRISDEY